MRVNVDEQALNEPRVKRMAKRLGRTHYEVLGRLVHVWMLCYSRRSAVLSEVDLDIAADLDGFAAALVAEEMGEHDESGGIYVRGVTTRIEFLEAQSEKGKRSGEARRMKAERTAAKPTANRASNTGSTDVQHRFRAGSTNHRTYSPDQDQALALAQDHAHPPGGGSFLAESEPEVQRAANGEKGKPALRVVEGGPDPTPAEPPIVQPGAAGEAVEPAKRKRAEAPPPPDQALTLGHLLLGFIIANQPTGRLARAPERVQDERALAWAHTIDKLNRIDKISWGEIEGMITWCQKDSFWKGVILGADNLRDKWDKMAAQRQSRGQRAQAAPAKSFDDVLDSAAAELEQRKEQGA